jgi:hypothetical protein
MKGALKEDHIPLNKYTLTIVGLPTLTVVSAGGMEEELNTVDLPDRTKASGGESTPSEMVVTIPMHHTIERVAMEGWFQEGKDPVSPGYKKTGVLIWKSGTGNILATYNVDGVFITKRTTPDGEMENGGEMATIEYTLSVDTILPA